MAAALSRHGVDVTGTILLMTNQDNHGVDESYGILAAAGLLDAIIQHRAQDFQRTGISASNWRYAEHPTTIWLDSDLGHVRTIVTGAERVNVATLWRFHRAVCPCSTSARRQSGRHILAEATVYVATADRRAPKSVCYQHVGRSAENGSEGANL